MLNLESLLMNKDNGNWFNSDIRLMFVCAINLSNCKCFDFDIIDCYPIYRDWRPKLRGLTYKYKPKIER
jgi:hypothetical protein